MVEMLLKVLPFWEDHFEAVNWAPIAQIQVSVGTVSLQFGNAGANLSTPESILSRASVIYQPIPVAIEKVLYGNVMSWEHVVSILGSGQWTDQVPLNDRRRMVCFFLKCLSNIFARPLTQKTTQKISKHNVILALVLCAKILATSAKQ